MEAMRASGMRERYKWTVIRLKTSFSKKVTANYVKAAKGRSFL